MVHVLFAMYYSYQNSLTIYDCNLRSFNLISKSPGFTHVIWFKITVVTIANQGLCSAVENKIEIPAFLYAPIKRGNEGDWE